MVESGQKPGSVLKTLGAKASSCYSEGKSPETQTSLETPLCHPSLVSSFTNTVSASAPSSDPQLGTQ